MGIETVATPLNWYESIPHLEDIKLGGIRQFIHQFQKDQQHNRDNGGPQPQQQLNLLFGDEVEYMLVRLDPDRQTVIADLDADQCLTRLRHHCRREDNLRRQQLEEDDDYEQKGDNSGTTTDDTACTHCSYYCRDFQWHVEYANYMVEGVPQNAIPINSIGGDVVERSMHERRKIIYRDRQKQQQEKQQRQQTNTNNMANDVHGVVTLSCLPNLGRESDVLQKILLQQAQASADYRDDDTPAGSLFENLYPELSVILDSERERKMVMVGEKSAFAASAAGAGAAAGEKNDNIHHHHPAAVSRSLFLSDRVTSPHVRYQTLTRNMRLRKGTKVCGILPAEGTWEGQEEKSVDDGGGVGPSVALLAGLLRGSSDAKHHCYFTTAAYQAAFEVEKLNRRLLRDPTVLRDPASMWWLTDPVSMICHGESGEGAVVSGKKTSKTATSRNRFVYTDCQAFGAGCCCVQATFGCRDLDEARLLYDNFLVLGPILLALTAATPCVRGVLLDTDTRWDLMSQTWDDRSESESALLDFGRFYSPRCYLNACAFLKQCRLSPSHTSASPEGTPSSVGDREEHLHDDCRNAATDQEFSETAVLNDVKIYIHDKGYRLLRDAHVLPDLARHVASLFVRDPLVVFADRVHLDDETDLDHWHSLNSTNWTTVRLKVPEFDVETGSRRLPWRVEVRGCEIQMSDFENAAIVAILHSLVRLFTVICPGLMLHMPISLVDENMRISAFKNAIVSREFWFLSESSMKKLLHRNPVADGTIEIDYKKRTLDSILFDGETGLLECALRGTECDDNYRRYVELFRRRCRGTLPTTARWIREFLRTDGSKCVSETRVYDLANLAQRIGLHPLKHLPDNLVSNDLKRNTSRSLS